jgi:Transposase, Mutator family
MRTPKLLYPQQRIIFRPEVSLCPHCNGPLQLVNSFAWDKTVQTLAGVVSGASRPARCANPACPGSSLRILSAEGQRLALPGSTFGYDVLAQIGWQRQQQHATFAEIHACLAPSVQISPTHVRQLYQQVYLPLLACHERQQRDRLAAVAQQHSGLLIALDGLAPEGGEAQLWCIRELLSGLTLRCGWLSQQDQATFEAFLQPLHTLEWPIVAVVSDKQRGLVPAVATVLPEAVHQFCQAHYLRNLAEPLAASDAAFNVSLRKAVRETVGDVIRAEAMPPVQQPGCLTITGLLPDAPSMPDTPPEPDTTADEAARAERVVTQLLRRTRYLLTLKGRPPFRLAGSETYQKLQQVVQLSRELLAHRHEPRLAQLTSGLQAALATVAPEMPDLRQGAAWLHAIAELLEPAAAEQAASGSEVARSLRSYLDQLSEQGELSPSLDSLRAHVERVSQSYWGGLFHCYDQVGLPRTNNGMESGFRDVRQRLVRTSGQQGQTRRALQRHGAWELVTRPASLAATEEALRGVESRALREEQARRHRHQERFRLHTRSDRQASAQFESLRQQWQALPGTLTG